MKGIKISELRALKAGEIQTKLNDKREELMKFRFQAVNGQLADTSQIKILRREIARMETILNEPSVIGMEGKV